MLEPLKHADLKRPALAESLLNPDSAVGPAEAIVIRIATAEDRQRIATTYLKLLRELESHDYDVLPTLENALFFTDQIFLPAALRGEPIVLAMDGEEVVGMILWSIQNLPYQVKWKTAFDYGAYVDPEYRRLKLVTRILDEGIKILKSNGVKRLLSGVSLSNSISLKASARLGFTPYQQLNYLDIG